MKYLLTFNVNTNPWKFKRKGRRKVRHSTPDKPVNLWSEPDQLLIICKLRMWGMKVYWGKSSQATRARQRDKSTWRRIGISFMFPRCCSPFNSSLFSQLSLSPYLPGTSKATLSSANRTAPRFWWLCRPTSTSLPSTAASASSRKCSESNSPTTDESLSRTEKVSFLSIFREPFEKLVFGKSFQLSVGVAESSYFRIINNSSNPLFSYPLLCFNNFQSRFAIEKSNEGSWWSGRVAHNYH